MIYIILSVFIVIEFARKINEHKPKGALFITETIADFLLICSGLLMLSEIWNASYMDIINTVIVYGWIAIKIAVIVIKKIKSKKEHGK